MDIFDANGIYNKIDKSISYSVAVPDLTKENKQYTFDIYKEIPITHKQRFYLVILLRHYNPEDMNSYIESDYAKLIHKESSLERHFPGKQVLSGHGVGLIVLHDEHLKSDQLKSIVEKCIIEDNSIFGDYDLISRPNMIFYESSKLKKYIQNKYSVPTSDQVDEEPTEVGNGGVLTPIP